MPFWVANFILMNNFTHRARELLKYCTRHSAVNQTTFTAYTYMYPFIAVIVFAGLRAHGSC